MIRHNGGYIPYSQDAEIWLEIQRKERVATRLKELHDSTKNPLVNEV